MTNGKFRTVVPWTASSLRIALESKGLRPKKGLGQHFLIDPNFCRCIVREAGLPTDAHVLEIGAGPGLLTAHLAPACARLTAVEIDPAMAALCREAVGGAKHVAVLERNIVDDEGRINLPASAFHPSTHASLGPTHPLHVFGNLPYNLSVPILIALLAWDQPMAQILCVVQREVGERLRAKPGSEMYGPLSVVAQGFAAVERVRAVPASVFRPRPRVESELVRLRPTGEGGGEVHAAWDALQRLFQSRRKTLGTALRRLGIPPADVERRCARAGASPEGRAESLPPAALLRLVQASRAAVQRADE